MSGDDIHNGKRTKIEVHTSSFVNVYEVRSFKNRGNALDLLDYFYVLLFVDRMRDGLSDLVITPCISSIIISFISHLRFYIYD